MNLFFDFTVDKPAQSIFITREFNAGLPLVWDAFTKQEILDQWGAPAPYVVKTKEMNFEEGGRRVFSMTSPEGNQRWSLQEYTSISPKTNFKMLTNFCDQDGNINSGLKSSENNLDFSESEGITKVNISIKYATPEILEMMIANGFKEGYTMTMNNLENLLASLSNKP